MKGKTWLWIALGALGLVSVCCVGVLIGGAIASGNATATQEAAAAATDAVASAPTIAPTESPIEPTAPPPTPTLPPPTPTLVPTLPPATQPPPVPTLVPTVTFVPPPPPPAAPPAAPPGSSDLQALVDYANAMQPLLEQATVLVERDGEILEASEGGNDAVLCDGQLAADHGAMAHIVNQVRGIRPPGDAAVIHDLVLRSGDAWTEALDNVSQFCSTGNQLFKIPAVLKFWEAAATFQDAYNRFWLLLLAEGVEDWVQR